MAPSSCFRAPDFSASTATAVMRPAPEPGEWWFTGSGRSGASGKGGGGGAGGGKEKKRSAVREAPASPPPKKCRPEIGGAMAPRTRPSWLGRRDPISSISPCPDTHRAPSSTRSRRPVVAAYEWPCVNSAARTGVACGLSLLSADVVIGRQQLEVRHFRGRLREKSNGTRPRKPPRPSSRGGATARLTGEGARSSEPLHRKKSRSGGGEARISCGRIASPGLTHRKRVDMGLK